MELYRLGSCRTENYLLYFSRPGSCYRCHPPNTFHSWSAQPPKRERLGFRENFKAQGLGAHFARRAGTALPRPRSTPLMSPRSFVSPRLKSRGDSRSRTGLQSSASNREGGRPASGDKSICTYIFVRPRELLQFGLVIWRFKNSTTKDFLREQKSGPPRPNQTERRAQRLERPGLCVSCSATIREFKPAWEQARANLVQNPDFRVSERNEWMVFRGSGRFGNR